MEDRQIISLYFARDESAIAATKEKYAPYCGSVAGNILDAPEDIEEVLSDTCLEMEFSRKGPKGSTLYDILYRQYVIPEDGAITIDRFLDISNLTQKEKAAGDIAYIELSGYLNFGQASVDENGTKLYDPYRTADIALQGRILFWSDGRYVYCVKIPVLPPHTGTDAVEAVISSLAPVEDISEYLTAK